jgi:hypothetical protein
MPLLHGRFILGADGGEAVSDLRCNFTGNLCGTDTWPKNRPCVCGHCQEYLCQERDRLAADITMLRAEVAHWRGNAKNTVSRTLFDAACETIHRLRQDNDTIRTAAQRVVDEIMIDGYEAYHSTNEIKAIKQLKETLK